MRDAIKTIREESEKKDFYKLKVLIKTELQKPKAKAPTGKSNKVVHKVLIFGDHKAGKKTFLEKSAKRKFDEVTQSNFGLEFYEKDQILAGKSIKLHIWNYGGGERNIFLLPTYTRGTDGALFIYDVTNYSSLAHIDEWLLVVGKEIRSENAFPIVVVGNKTDLLDSREVSGEDGIKIAKSRGTDGFIECSSKTGENVEEAIAALTRLMMERSDLV